MTDQPSDITVAFAKAFAKAGFSAPQHSLADIATECVRAYLAQPEVVERAAAIGAADAAALSNAEGVAKELDTFALASEFTAKCYSVTDGESFIVEKWTRHAKMARQAAATIQALEGALKEWLECARYDASVGLVMWDMPSLDRVYAKARSLLSDPEGRGK